MSFMESVSTCEKCVCIVTFCKIGKKLIFFLNLNLLRHLENATIFFEMRDICDVFMNESEIKLKERIEGERFKEILIFQL
jgi:hypothetical protein